MIDAAMTSVDAKRSCFLAFICIERMTANPETDQPRTPSFFVCPITYLAHPNAAYLFRNVVYF